MLSPVKQRPLVIVLSVVLTGLVACGGDDDDDGSATQPATVLQSGDTDTDIDTDTDTDDDADQGTSASAGSIVVDVGEQQFEFVTSPPRPFEFDGNQYGACSVTFGVMRASGYALDGSDTVVNLQVTEPGETGSWISVKDGDTFFDGESDATFLWEANRANVPADDPLYNEIAEDRQIGDTTASGSVTFVNARADMPQQVAGSFEVNCGS